VPVSPSTFSVLQFNSLAKGLSGKEGGFVCPEEGTLDWMPRRARILEEVVERDADLIGMQGTP
jgi:mRNA deadenylase 3'-5' endonuclease subunit Ccr4